MVVFYHINYLLFFESIANVQLWRGSVPNYHLASKKPVNQGSLKITKQRMRVTYSISILPNNIAD